jgi:hypothetical protein
MWHFCDIFTHIAKEKRIFRRTKTLKHRIFRQTKTYPRTKTQKHQKLRQTKALQYRTFLSNKDIKTWRIITNKYIVLGFFIAQRLYNISKTFCLIFTFSLYLSLERWGQSCPIRRISLRKGKLDLINAWRSCTLHPRLIPPLYPSSPTDSLEY